MKKYSKAQKEAYSFKNYKANKNCKSVEYKNMIYLSKMQCMVLNDLERKELDEYLKNNEAE